MLRLTLVFVCLAAVVSLACALDLQEGAPYLIRNFWERSFLKVDEERRICDPLSPVMTTLEERNATIWLPNWWGDVEFWGVHFDSSHPHNAITFQNYPPNCFPIYYHYDLVDVNEGTQMRVRDSDLCLTANGNQPVDLQTCGQGMLTKVWHFKKG